MRSRVDRSLSLAVAGLGRHSLNLAVAELVRRSLSWVVGLVRRSWFLAVELERRSLSLAAAGLVRRSWFLAAAGMVRRSWFLAAERSSIFRLGPKAPRIGSMAAIRSCFSTAAASTSCVALVAQQRPQPARELRQLRTGVRRSRK
jgi:hypothetical protein